MVDPCSAKFLLTVGGALAELTGIGLVVWDVRDVRAAAKGVDPGPRKKWVGNSLRSRFNFKANLTGGAPPPLDERVAALEAALAELRDTMGVALSDLRHDLGERVSAASMEARQLVGDHDHALRLFLRDQLEGGIRRRWVGAALFSVGVVLSALANLV